MATVTWESFYPFIQPDLPGCPKATIDITLAEAAADFCSQTRVWRVDFDQDTTVIGEDQYEIDIPPFTVIENILWVVLNSRELYRIGDRLGERMSGVWTTRDQADESGQPVEYSFYQDQYLRLYPIPDAAYSFHGAAVVKPSLAAKGIEKYIYETHGRVIASGALYRLMSIPGKDWTNPQLAEHHFLLFERGITQARVRDYRNVPLRVKPHHF